MFRTFLDNDFVLQPTKTLESLEFSEVLTPPIILESTSTEWERVECEESGTIFYKHKNTQETKWER